MHHQVDFLVDDLGTQYELFYNAQFSTVGRKYATPSERKKIYDLLDRAKDYNLEYEIQEEALRIHRENPYCDVLATFEQAYQNWIK